MARFIRSGIQEIEILTWHESDPSRPDIPLLDSEKLLRIASLFSEMGMNAKAGRAYREALYGAFAPPEFPEFGDETWISPSTADALLAIARVEAMLGQKMWSVQALLMAVASSRSQLLPAKVLLRETLNAQNMTPEPAPDAAKLTEIAILYRDCNLHPRAILALDAAAKIPGVDVAELRADIEKAWEELVSSFAYGREQVCFLFGHKVLEHELKLELSPAPFPYGDER